jgi:glyoxylate reductase
VRIVATRRLPGPAWDALPDVEIAPLGEAGDADALIVMNEMPDLARFPSLKLVATFGVGYDNIDVEACRARGVAVTNTPGVLDAATADLAFALILGVRRRVVEGDRLVRAGRWSTPWSAGPFLGRDVAGATLGIVGMGRIGSALARRAAAFDMTVIHHRRTRDGEGWRELDALLAEADIVSLHAPLSPATTGLISRERLRLLRNGATLVNTARGAIVDEDALVEELVSGRINAGLDVFVNEPHVPGALLDLPNVVLAPHIGSATVETRAAMTRLVVDNVLAFVRGEPLLTPV